MAEGFESLGDGEARRAFVHTARSVIDPTGQRVDATDRLYLAAHVPSLVVWGERDRMIPVEHGRQAHALMPNSRFEEFAGAGHFPSTTTPSASWRCCTTSSRPPSRPPSTTTSCAA